MLDWDKAEEKLNRHIKEYSAIGMGGRPALMMLLWPLENRLQSGERTQDLYDAIMEIAD